MYQPYFSNRLDRRMTPVIKYLLFANAGMFILTALGGKSLESFIMSGFILKSDLIFPRFQIWRLISYSFLHANFWHVFFNMLMLWMFGRDVELSIGSQKFGNLYIISTIVGGLSHILFFSSPVIGASGAVYGVMTAYAVLFSERIITLLLFFILPIRLKAKYLILILIGGSVLGFCFDNSNIAHLAHIGGALGGFIFLWLPFYLRQAQKPQPSKKPNSENPLRLIHSQQQKEIQKEIDILLDKINQNGYQSLSDAERQKLHEYSQRLNTNFDESN